MMDSARDFDLLGESVPQVRVSARALPLLGFLFFNIYIYICIYPERGSQNKLQVEKIPEGQEYAPRLEPAAPIRIADRNHMHYPSRHRTILKKDGSMTDFQHTQSDAHGSDRKMLHVLLTHLPPRCALTFSPLPKGKQSNA